MSPRSSIRLFAILSLLGLLFGASPVHMGLAAPLADSSCVYRVKWDATGSSHDGSTWANAFTDLQSALTTASNGCEIWVAAGTYTPTHTADRTISFQLVSGVSVYGGFKGEEDYLPQRDSNPATNGTVLSGDIDYNDATDGNGGNSYHVVIGADQAILDGFTISGGNANEPCYGGPITCFGGGMYNTNSSPTVRNIIFSGNQAIEGGGMQNYISGRPVLTNVIFTGNSANNGGGLENYEGANTDLNQVTFANNSATKNGGGMFDAYNGSSHLIHVTFSGNSARNGGWFERNQQFGNDPGGYPLQRQHC